MGGRRWTLDAGRWAVDGARRGPPLRQMGVMVMGMGKKPSLPRPAPIHFYYSSRVHLPYILYHS